MQCFFLHSSPHISPELTTYLLDDRILQSQMIGSPATDEIAKIMRTEIREVLSERPVIAAKNMAVVFAKAPAPAIEILVQSLKFDPEKRSVDMNLVGRAD